MEFEEDMASTIACMFLKTAHRKCSVSLIETGNMQSFVLPGEIKERGLYEGIKVRGEDRRTFEDCFGEEVMERSWPNVGSKDAQDLQSRVDGLT
jgi:hypothetical protein